jgi:hypothetical protein
MRRRSQGDDGGNVEILIGGSKNELRKFRSSDFETIQMARNPSVPVSHYLNFSTLLTILRYTTLQIQSQYNMWSQYRGRYQEC